jgi:hypothetical protein
LVINHLVKKFTALCNSNVRIRMEERKETRKGRRRHEKE